MRSGTRFAGWDGCRPGPLASLDAAPPESRPQWASTRLRPSSTLLPEVIRFLFAHSLAPDPCPTQYLKKCRGAGRSNRGEENETENARGRALISGALAPYGAFPSVHIRPLLDGSLRCGYPFRALRA